MMHCDEARPLLDLLCDGGLDAKDSAMVVEHVNRCSQCQDDLTEIEELRKRFQSARTAASMPAELPNKIISALNEESRVSRSKASAGPYRFFLAAAAVVLLSVATLAIIEYGTGRPVNAIASADLLVKQVSDQTDVRNVVDKAQLPARLGYQPLYVRLPDWKMIRSSVNTGSSSVPIARFDFVKEAAQGKQSLTCYQAPQGTIHTATGSTSEIAGKQVRFGSQGAVQFALWSQNGRDYLFVTRSGRDSLENIVRGA